LGFGHAFDSSVKGADLSPYLSEEALDPKWVEKVIKTGALVADRKV
jgi:hypothetical protein